jgi:serine/threonine protein kinase
MGERWMADSLFDNRYRYDYIYPRGRSGETLRAVDTEASERPVVIKRPAPNDAPPIRAGQEVSILNERKALMRLSGHPVLTQLMGTGQFSVGGTPHQYIVMERAEGVIVADLVLELSSRGEYLPELEMLVIIDHLLDLLEAAHERDIVYNDVDAKHLFWDRDNHRLKLIDWGNAVFLEGDEATPQGISRQSDIGQVGELLYFIVTGGKRIEVPRDAGENFHVQFGDDSDRVHSRLQGIISKAVHPNLRLRYASIAELRKDLADYRVPIQRERDLILGRVSERLRHNRSRDELNGLLHTVEQALAMDPGYPPSREQYHEIMLRLQQIEIAADLDAIQIYLQNGNWSRAINLLDELRDKAYGETAVLISLLFDMAMILHDSDMRQAPVAVRESIAFLFDGQPADAAHILLTEGSDRHTQWLLAERISAYIPDIQLLRPNLYRLELALRSLAAEGVPMTEPQAVLAEVNATLDAMAASPAVPLTDLRDNYRAVVDGLTALQTLLDAVNVGRGLPDRKLPFSALERASNAVMNLADNIHVIGKQAAASPRDATGALDSSRAIDPGNPLWEAIGRRLEALYELLGICQTYVPAADGSDLLDWLKNTRSDLQPFVEYLFDEMLVGMWDGVEIAAKAWMSYANATVQGNRASAISALTQATDAVGTISPTLAGWFNQLRALVNGAQYIERHALYGGLGRALADGWEAFDRGRLADAEQLGQRAFEIAQNDPQRFAADRLRRLSEITRSWIERNGVNDAQTTKAALVSVERLFTVNETETRENFTRQMPSKDTYLKAMSKGLVELYGQRSTAAVRILYVIYILSGVLDAHEKELDDAAFWHEAALRTLEPHAAKHVATRTLEEFIARRRDILTAAEQINRLTGAQALPELEGMIQQLEANPQARTLAAGIHSLRELQAALRDWSDGEFRPAGIKLENAINAVNDVEQAADITLTPYRAWLMELNAVAAELHTRARQMLKIIEGRPAQPDPALSEGHELIYTRTAHMLGDAFTPTLLQWRDTYEAFCEAYSNTSVRRSARLTRFNELFRAMFIDRHPAYPLYRHWYDLTDQSPEFPAPPTAEPTPQLDEAAGVPEIEYRSSPQVEAERETPRRTRIPRVALLGGLVGVAAIVVVLIALNAPEGGTIVPVTITDTPIPDTSATADASGTTPTAAVTESGAQGQTVAQGMTEFATPTLRATEPQPTATETPVPLTSTPAPTNTPLPTHTPTDTHTPTATSTPSSTPTPTLPPQGIQGRQDLLALFQRMDAAAYPWTREQFSRGADGTFWRLGVGSAGEGEIIYIRLSPELLETYFGNNAASRIRRMEATMTLTTFNPPMLLDNAVYFGALLQDAANPDATVGLQVQLVQAGVINLGQRSGSTVRTVSQRSVNAAVVRIRLERDLQTGAITTFFNDEQVGQPMTLAAANAPLLPVLFVRDGGVIVSVTDWHITLN